MKLRTKNLLKNPMVFYLVILLSVASLFSYLRVRNLTAIVFFGAVTVLVNYLCKNRNVALLVAVVSTYLLNSYTNIFSRLRIEGFKEGQDDDADTDEGANTDTDEGANTDDNTDKKKAGKTDDNTDKKKAGKTDDNTDDNIDDNTDDNNTLEKNEEKMTNYYCTRFDGKDKCNSDAKCSWNGTECISKIGDLQPAEYPSSGNKIIKPNLDKAKTLEAAYDNLEKVIGTDAVRSMSDDTKKLANRQNELMDQIKDLGPLISQTTKMIKSIDVDSMIKNLNSKMASFEGDNKQVPQGALDKTPE